MTDLIFQKNLQDLIKTIRANKRDPAGLIATSIADAKNELRSTDAYIKAEAVRKLTYMQMIGYDISWASFGIVEVMAMPRFSHKRIGFLAGNQSFTEKTDVLMLTTNLLKRLFGSVAADGSATATTTSARAYEVGLGISSLANIVNMDLSRDCMSDIVTLMKHPNNYVRKKAVLVMYKMYLKYPQGLRLTFDSLKAHLDDPDISVTSTAVNVVCELANKNPRNYLAMAPKFFQLLTTSTNNWLLIKIVKLFGSLVSEEPRLARKLLEPLMKIIKSTGAKSLQYECIFTITQALLYHRKTDGSESKHAAEAVRVCSERLRGFVEDADPNLRYMGLVGLAELLPSAPRSVVEHRELVLRCLGDDDVTVKTRALELLSGMASRKSLSELVNHLMDRVRRSDGKFRDELIGKILDMCSRDRYALVSDFRWFVKVLVTLASLPGGCLSPQHGEEVTACLMDLALRVEAIRPQLTQNMLRLMVNARGQALRGRAKASDAAIQRAAAWIVGEYCDALVSATTKTKAKATSSTNNADVYAGTDCVHVELMDTLLHPGVVRGYPASVQRVYMHCAVKVLASACSVCSRDDMAVVVALLRQRLVLFLSQQQEEELSAVSVMDPEVRERALSLRFLLDQLHIVPVGVGLGAGMGDAVTGYGDVSTADVASGSGVVVTAGDLAGADKALEQRGLIASLVSEPFYAVHPKAQRKVPLPAASLLTPLNPDVLLSVLGQSETALFSGSRNGMGAAMQSLSLVSPTPFITGVGGVGRSGGDDGIGHSEDEEYSPRRRSRDSNRSGGISNSGSREHLSLTAEEKRVSDALMSCVNSNDSNGNNIDISSRDRKQRSSRGRDIVGNSAVDTDTSVFMLGNNNNKSSIDRRVNSNSNGNSRNSSRSPAADFAGDMLVYDNDGDVVTNGAVDIQSPRRSSSNSRSRKSSTTRGAEAESEGEGSPPAATTRAKVDATELLPAGARVDDDNMLLVSSDEELIRQQQRHRRQRQRPPGHDGTGGIGGRGTRGKLRSGGGGGGEDALATIDITTPLESTEVLHVLQHRNVTNTTTSPGPGGDLYALSGNGCDDHGIDSVWLTSASSSTVVRGGEYTNREGERERETEMETGMRRKHRNKHRNKNKHEEHKESSSQYEGEGEDKRHHHHRHHHHHRSSKRSGGGGGGHGHGDGGVATVGNLLGDM